MKLTHIGGPTVLIEAGGWRLLTDPTFDPPGRSYRFGWGTGSRKLAGPAIAPEDLGPIDAVLLSHDHHDDNLDPAGRALLPSWGSALANIHPGKDDTWVDYDNEGRAPLLFISGSVDHLMPPSIQRSNAKHWNDKVVTEVKEFEGPHLLPAWPGWEQVADYALDWAERHAGQPIRV